MTLHCNTSLWKTFAEPRRGWNIWRVLVELTKETICAWRRRISHTTRAGRIMISVAIQRPFSHNVDRHSFQRCQLLFFSSLLHFKKGCQIQQHAQHSLWSLASTEYNKPERPERTQVVSRSKKVGLLGLADKPKTRRSHVGVQGWYISLPNGLTFRVWNKGQ